VDRQAWPRDLDVRESDRLDAVLESHLPDVDPMALDPVFLHPELRALVHLVVNAILFITTADEPWFSGNARGRRSSWGDRSAVTAEARARDPHERALAYSLGLVCRRNPLRVETRRGVDAVGPRRRFTGPIHRRRPPQSFPQQEVLGMTGSRDRRTRNAG
jgi:hypothetical protein